MRFSRRVALAIATLALALTAAPTWAATQVSLDGSGDLDVVGDSNENRPTVTEVGDDLRVTDTHTAVTAGSGCTLDTGVAVCPKVGVTRIHMVGNNGPDKLVVDWVTISLPALLEGGAQNDELRGGGGPDVLLGGTEDDTLWGYGGADTLTGGDGTDMASYTERLTAVTVTLDSQANDGDAAATENDNVQTENLTGSQGADMLVGNDLAQSIDGGPGVDTIYGRGGNDGLHGSYFESSGNFLYGEDGDDFLGGDGGDDTLEGGNGNDTIHGYAGVDTLRGGDGNDLLQSRGGTDAAVEGGPGDDTVGYTDHSAVLFDGGPGYDYIDLQGINQGAYSVTLDGVANDSGPYGPTNVKNFERIYTSWHGDTIVGSSADERIESQSGDDTIDGGGGNDYLIPGGGADVVIGGDGNDTADFSTENPCTVTLDGIANDGPAGNENAQTENVVSCTGTSTVVGDAGDNYIQGVGGNQTLSGGEGNDRIAGGSDTDTVNGGPGDDELLGEHGTDTLNGDVGDDRLIGGTQNDVLNGGEGIDLADYSDSVYPITVTLGAGANDGQLTRGEADDVQTDGVIGSFEIDVLTGDSGANRLYGGGKNDQLRGGDGDDLLDGGSGADLLDGEGGNDTADYSTTGAPVSVRLNGAADDGFTGENDNALTENVWGSDLGDTLEGDGGPNVLVGGDGADTISGLAGDDLVSGGPGTDTLSSGAGADSILARDNEADALTCDSLTGKSILADAIDTSTTCDLSEFAPGGGSPVIGTPVFGPGTPAATPGAGPGLLDAAALAATLRGMPRSGTTMKLSGPGDVLELGELDCPGCSAKVDVTYKAVAGKRAKKAAKAVRIGGGKLKVGADRTSVTAKLSAKGWKLLRAKRKLEVRVTIVLSLGKLKASVGRNLVLKRGKS